MKQETYEWEFKALNPVDFEFRLYLQTQHQLMESILNKSNAILKRKKAIKGGVSLNDVEGWTVDPLFHNQVKNFADRLLKDPFRQIGYDGVVIINHYVTKCTFKRDETNPKKWHVTIIYNGTYTHKKVYAEAKVRR